MPFSWFHQEKREIVIHFRCKRVLVFCEARDNSHPPYFRNVLPRARQHLIKRSSTTMFIHNDDLVDASGVNIDNGNRSAG